jgi:hypothetical protein
MNGRTLCWKVWCIADCSSCGGEGEGEVAGLVVIVAVAVAVAVGNVTNI